MKLFEQKLALITFTLLTTFCGSFAHADADDVRGCLKQAFAKDNPVYQVPEDSGNPEGYDAYLSIMCNKDAAKALYSSIKVAPLIGEWSGKVKGEFKYVGQVGGASMCYHTYRNSDGDVIDEYSCSIRLNVSPSVLGPTKNKEMAAFPIK
jgi:hypothetical protein